MTKKDRVGKKLSKSKSLNRPEKLHKRSKNKINFLTLDFKANPKERKFDFQITHTHTHYFIPN